MPKETRSKHKKKNLDSQKHHKVKKWGESSIWCSNLWPLLSSMVKILSYTHMNINSQLIYAIILPIKLNETASNYLKTTMFAKQVKCRFI